VARPAPLNQSLTNHTTQVVDLHRQDHHNTLGRWFETKRSRRTRRGHRQHTASELSYRRCVDEAAASGKVRWDQVEQAAYGRAGPRDAGRDAGPVNRGRRRPVRGRVVRIGRRPASPVSSIAPSDAEPGSTSGTSGGGKPEVSAPKIDDSTDDNGATRQAPGAHAEHPSTPAASRRPGRLLLLKSGRSVAVHCWPNND
jgi:hypothetical protein